MNTPKPAPVVPEPEGLIDTSSQPKEDKMTPHRPAKARTERRFEIGFFIRKIINGRLAYYKQIARQRSSIGFLETAEVEGGHQVRLTEIPHAMAMAHSGRGSAEDEVEAAHDGPGPGGGDPGPIGSTQIEVGFFVGTTTETTGDDES